MEVTKQQMELYVVEIKKQVCFFIIFCHLKGSMSVRAGVSYITNARHGVCLEYNTIKTCGDNQHAYVVWNDRLVGEIST